MLVVGYTPFRAVTVSLLAIVVVGAFNPRTRLSLGAIIEAFAKSARDVVSLVAASASVAYIIGQISMQEIHQLQLIAGVMMLAGLFFVWLKIGRRWRAWRALWRPQTCWMTRELYAAGVFLA